MVSAPPQHSTTDMAAASSTSSPFFETRPDESQSLLMMMPHQQQQQSPPAAPPPPKKRRNQPGTPYPDAEVIALSPKTLMATNRFICEVCNKGFQREQNLQLHRRGHNLPWKLKQKSTKEVVRRKVYLCPEVTCAHHDASRALGDLTGIKKHYYRKHGEKKWKCDKCSKRYAVQSDWKAHSKTCGTREYRCDCGTLFSRRDSFVTHRAFCDALAQESGGAHRLYGHNNRMSLLLGHSQVGPTILQDRPNYPSAANSMLRLGGAGPTKFEHLTNSLSSFGQAPQSSGFFMPEFDRGFGETLMFPNKGMMSTMTAQLPDFHGAAAGFFSNNVVNGNSTDPGSLSNSVDNCGGGGFMSPGHQFGCVNFAGVDGLPSIYDQTHRMMSATALLQKAAQVGSTSSDHSSNLGTQMAADHESSDLRGLMSTLAGGGEKYNSVFGGGFGGGRVVMGHDGAVFGDDINLRQSFGVSMGGSDKPTLDFLGVGGMVRNFGAVVGGMSEKERQHGINNDHV